VSAASTRTAEWTRRAERGNLSLLRLMAWISLHFGRRLARIPLRAVAAYFLVAGGTAREAAREFLRRVHGRAPTLGEQYDLFFTFASTVHDRVYLLKDRFDLFDIDVRGADLFDGRGALLMGSHLGSFEVMRASGRHFGQRRVVMAMYEENARRINSVLASIDPAAMQDIVALGRPDSMVELARRLDAGALAGVLADRTLGDEPAVQVEFLGRPAAFPTGPMRMAAALRQRVMFMAGLYRGGNRYDIRFEPLADFGDLDGVSRAERDRRIEQAVHAYAKCLERHARDAPSNWFNFHDFWRSAA
jgi:hypothetical protein